MENKSLQEIYSAVKTHLITQGKQSVGKRVDSKQSPSCLYRGEDGAKCAIGALIPDNLYDDVIEGLPVATLPTGLLLCCGLDYRAGDVMGLLEDLQEVHDEEDNWETPYALVRALQAVAHKYSLKA